MQTSSVASPVARGHGAVLDVLPRAAAQLLDVAQEVPGGNGPGDILLFLLGHGFASSRSILLLQEGGPDKK